MDQYGRVVNALFVVVVAAFAVGAVIAWRRGALRSDRKTFEERGYIQVAALGAVAPSRWLVAVLVGFSLVVFPLFAVLVVIAVQGDWVVAGLMALFLPGVVIWTFLLVYAFVRLWVDRRLAALMRSLGPARRVESDRAERPPSPGDRDPGSSRADAEPTSGSARPSVADDSPPRIHVIEMVLDGGAPRAPPRPAEATNGTVQGASRIVYLWNFDTGWTTLDRDIKSWRRYGPVYMLQSPRCLPLWDYFRLALVAPERFFVTGPEDLENRLTSAEERPASWGFRLGRNRSFRRIGIPCTDHVWQIAIRRLCALADIVIVDARGFTEERAGLAWEIGHVVQSVPPDRFVILADLSTDRRLLERRIRSFAPPESDSGAIRIVDEARGRPPHLRFNDSGQALGCDYRADRLAQLLFPPNGG